MSYLDCAHARAPKRGQRIAGDVWLVRRVPEEDRLVCALCDGLGSGVKANVLAALTATMAVRHTADGRDPAGAARVLARTLPVCSVRGIGYAAFSLVDVDGAGRLRLSEYGNPPALLLRDGRATPIPTQAVTADGAPGRELRTGSLDLRLGDRLVVVSDGVTQAGMGARATPLGWGEAGLSAAVEEALAHDPGISAHALAEAVVAGARGVDGGAPHDDTTCGVVHLRLPRRLLVCTGAPYDLDRDQEFAWDARDFDGRKAICGGTTAEIIARVLRRRVHIQPTAHGDLPPGRRSTASTWSPRA